jgi:RNA polymerase sigma factor (TIGR02999 family)
MADASGPSVTELFARVEAGDAAARRDLFAALYADLHRLAQSHVRRSAGPITLGATTLLHEAYLAMSGREAVYPDRQRFFGYASRAMRGLIINYVRERQAQKRGGTLTFTTLDEGAAPAAASADLERLGEALDELAGVEPALAELVDLKFFCGFSFTEIAAMRGVSDRTVQRDWAKARLLLHRALDEDGPVADTSRRS